VSRKESTKDDVIRIIPWQLTPQCKIISATVKPPFKTYSNTLATREAPVPDSEPSSADSDTWSWIQRLKQAFRDGWVIFRKAKWLTTGFATVIIAIFAVTHVEVGPQPPNIVKEKNPPFGLGVWLRTMSTALRPDSKH